MDCRVGSASQWAVGSGQGAVVRGGIRERRPGMAGDRWPAAWHARPGGAGRERRSAEVETVMAADRWTGHSNIIAVLAVAIALAGLAVAVWGT